MGNAQDARMRRNAMSSDNIIKEVVFKHTFIAVGNVSKVYSKGARVDVTLPVLSADNLPTVYPGIEVLRPGTQNIRVEYEPKVGDVAIVFTAKNYYPSVEYGKRPVGFDVEPYYADYDIPNMKAIIVQTNVSNSDALTIAIKDNEVTIDVPDSIANVKINAKKIDINKGHLTVT